MVVESLLDRLRSAPPRAGTTRVIAVDGPSGSGKTTLSRALQDAETTLCVVHLDDIYPGWDGLAAAIPNLVDWVLRPLSAGRPAVWKRYDWLRREYAEDHPVPATGLLAVEGAGAGSRLCAPYLSLLVYVDAPEALRYRRGIGRDGETYRPHWDQWAEQEKRHWAEHRPAERADIVLSGGGGLRRK